MKNPGMNLVPKWNVPCQWWNASYCLHVFAGLKFHPWLKSFLSKRQDENSFRDDKKKKTCANTLSRDEMLQLSYVLTLFLTDVLNMLSNFNRLEQIKSYKKDAIGSFWNPKNETRKSISFIFFLKFTKGWNFPLFLSLL